MKKIQSHARAARGLALGALIAGCSAVQAQDKPQYVVQTDLETGVYVYIDVDGPEGVGEVSGKFVALLPIMEAGSRFELYAKGTPPDEELYNLYEIAVGSFPNIEIKTWSDDPYATVTRTRADFPFQVEMTASNIDPDSTIKGKRELYYERVVVDYASDGNAPPEGAEEKLIETYFFNENGTKRAHLVGKAVDGTMDDILPTNADYPYKEGDPGELSNLTYQDIARTGESSVLYNQRGEEYYRVYAYLGDDLGWGKIAEKKVQVWPIAQSDLDAVVSGVRYDSVEPDGQRRTFTAIPTLEVDLWNLYPTSQTWMRVYKGEYNKDGVPDTDVIFTTEAKNFNTTAPQTANLQITAGKWDNDNIADGTYTVEVLTKTPFYSGQPEILVHATFELKRTLNISGSVTDSEQK